MSICRTVLPVHGLAVFAFSVLGLTRSAVGGAPRSTFNKPLTAFDASAVERAKVGAARWLQDSECLKVLTDFTDGESRTLDRNLEPWGLSAAEYVLTLPFRDGAAMTRCRETRVELVTDRGLPQIYVCPGSVGAVHSRFARTQTQNPSLAEAMVIHEMLHTLGLGENPPSSIEITERVRTRCR